MIELIDQIGHRVELSKTPERIISVVPSQTELLYALGLDDEVVGITKFCVHPTNWFKNKQRVGGTKKLNLELIKTLAPDLILANKEENTEVEIRALQQNYKVYTSDISNLNQSLEMIGDVGELTGKTSEAQELISSINKEFSQLIPDRSSNKKVLYFIWKDPYMSIGTDTFIHDMLERCGFENALKTQHRYPEIKPEEITALSPEYIFLSSEPFPFSAKHIAELKELSPYSEVVLVDGEYFSWYGSRLTEAPKYFAQLLN